MIRWCSDTFETISRWQLSTQTHLEFLERHALGKTLAHTLTAAGLIRPVSPEILLQARSACSELRLIGKPGKRSRRPTAAKSPGYARFALESAQERPARPIERTVLAGDDRRDALAHRGTGIGFLEEADVVEAVCVDEAGREKKYDAGV